ncbi:copper resistance protein CopC [Oceanobacillus iheyensis]|uniref:copper resistance CopC family protein n=1 Tax=Oceanobacillus iheyensis TaxID=182710 RepID=UPI00363177B1
MKKISMLLFVAILFLFSANTVFAHTHLDSSDPEDGSTITESIDTIQLNFDTVIEQNASLQVENSEGDTFENTDISITEGKLVATLEEELPNGSYTVTWDIIGVDGHAMQDSISFEVDAEELEEASEEDNTEETNTTEEDESMTEDNQSESEDSTTTNETNEETASDSSSNTMIIAILLVAIIAIIGIVLIRKKK